MAKNEVVKIEKNITDVVLNRVIAKQMNGTLQLPKDYSAQNALMSAYLKLQDIVDRNKKPVLSVCTKDSVANALMSMVTQGLNPMKNQGYFIPYGNQLQFQRSYLGTIAITKRAPGVKDVKAYPVYKTDEFSLGFDILTGKQTVETFKPGTDRNEKDLIGAFAMILGENEILHTEWMTMEQIRKAWSMGQTKGDSPAHKGFPDQMAIKTVINRACKTFADTTDDADLITSLGQSQGNTDMEVEAEIEANANQELIGVPEAEYTNVDIETGEILEEPEVDDDPFKDPPF